MHKKKRNYKRRTFYKSATWCIESGTTTIFFVLIKIIIINIIIKIREKNTKHKRRQNASGSSCHTILKLMCGIFDEEFNNYLYEYKRISICMSENNDKINV